MRFAIFFLLSVLLVPAFSASSAPWKRRYSPSSSPPPSNLPSSPLSYSLYSPSTPPLSYSPSPPSSPHRLVTPPPDARQSPPILNPPPPHGRVVHYQGTNGPQRGIILGSQPDQRGRYNLTPLSHDQAGHPIIHYDRVVKAHEGDIVHTERLMPNTASDIRAAHARNPPTVTRVTGPVEGSAHYRAPQSPGHSGHPDAGNHGRSGRRR